MLSEKFYVNNSVNFNFSTEELQAIQNTYVPQNAPSMSHQTSQQTVIPQRPIFESSSALQFMPTFDTDDEVADSKSPLNVGTPNSYYDAASSFHVRL